MLQAMIFDLDGTLADTVAAIRSGLNMALAQVDYPTHTHEEILSYINHGARELVRQALPPHLGHDEDEIDRVLALYNQTYALTYLETKEPYEGIPEALAALNKAGCRLAVLSNKQDEFVKKLMPILLPGLPFFDCVGQRKGSPKKPDPTVPLALAAAMGVAPAACAFVGDSDVDMETAHRAGMLAVGVAWGFRPADVLQENGADVIVNTPSELIGLLNTTP